MANVTAQGSKLHRRAQATTGVWVAVAGIVDFNGFGAETPEVVCSTLDSTAAEYKAGLRDFGSAEFTLYPDMSTTTQYRQLVGDQQSGLVTGWALELPSLIGTVRYLHTTGFVKTTPIQGGVDAMVSSNFSVRLSGDVILTTTLP